MAEKSTSYPSPRDPEQDKLIYEGFKALSKYLAIGPRPERGALNMLVCSESFPVPLKRSAMWPPTAGDGGDPNMLSPGASAYMPDNALGA